MKLRPATARPYARALFALAKNRGQAELIGRELDSVAEVLRQTPVLGAFLARPWVPATAKRDAAGEIATRLGLSKLTHDFVALVAAHGRGEHLGAIAAAYAALLDEDLGRVRARVRTAVPLTETERERLRERLGRALSGKQVVLEEALDRELLGGFVAESGSFLIDGSLDTQLARLGARLAGG